MSYAQTPYQAAQIAAAQQYNMQAAQQAAAAAEYQQQLVAASEQGFSTGGVVPSDIGTQLTTADFDRHTKRTFFVTLEASLNDLQRGTKAAEWHAEEGKEHIFQRISGMVNGKPLYDGDVTKGVMLGMNLWNVSSTFPVDIGVNLTGVLGGFYEKGGKSYAFIAEAGKTVNYGGKCIHQPASPITREMLAKYDDTSVEKLKDTYARVGSGMTTMVDNNSPLGEMLRINAGAFNMTIAPPRGAQCHLVVPNDVVDACIARYEMDQKVDFMNMKNFKGTFERVGAATWDDPAGLIDNIRSTQRGADGHVGNKRLENVYKITAMVEVALNLMGGAKTQTAVAAAPVGVQYQQQLAY